MLEELGVGVVPVRVYFGSENYLDKVTITPSEFYGALRRDRRGAEDVAAAAGRLHAGLRERRDARRRRSCRSTLGRASRGPTRRRSSGARPVAEDEDRARGQPQRLGRARPHRARGGRGGRGRQERRPRWRRSRATRPTRVRLFVAVPTLEHLVRGGRVSPRAGFVAKLLGLLPVLTITREGKVEAAAKARGYAAARRKMMRAALRRGRRARERLAPLRRRALRRGGRRRGARPRDPRALSRVRRHDRRVRAGARRARRAGALAVAVLP